MHVLQILPGGLLTMTRARVFSVHSKQTPKHAFEKKHPKINQKDLPCDRSRKQRHLGRPGRHPSKPEFSCALRSPFMSHQNSLLGNKAPLKQWGMSSQSSSSQCSFPVSCASPTLLSGQRGMRTVGIQVWYQHILLERKAIST